MVAKKGTVNASATMLDLPGETSSVKQRVATNDGRMFTQSLLEIFWELEKIGECLGYFDASNIERVATD